VIAEYVEALAGKLSFDCALSRCVRQEVEDHLREAVAADPAGAAPEAERRAVARFGDADAIAGQFAVASLAGETRRIAAAVVVVIAGVFLAMKARLAWYALTQWALSADAMAASAIVGAVDRYAFWLSVVVGLAGWAYLRGGRAPGAFHPSWRKRPQRFLLLCAVATGALLVSVASDGVLTALRLLETEWSADFAVPLFSMAIEIACAGVLVARIRAIALRTASTAALLRGAKLGV
jgi:hypothetical protein